VLDPFAGSGTTNFAAKNLGRNSVGYEINPEFIPVIKQKLQSNQKDIHNTTFDFIIKVEDVAPRGFALDRATVRQKKTGHPVKFELTEQTRQALDDYIKAARKQPGEFLFAGRRGGGQCLTTRQYARLVSEWIASIGLDPLMFGTHSLRRAKATLIYKRTGNLRAVQLLLGHTKIESTVRYLGIEVDDALAIAEQVEV